MTFLRSVSTILLLSFGTSGLSGRTIALAPADLQRLGIAFAPVRAAEGEAGPRFPAAIVSSPDGVGLLTAPYAGVLESWLVAPGTAVRAGQPVAVVRSQDALRVQQDWMDAVTKREGARFELEKSERLFAGGIIAASRVAQARRDHEQAVFAEQAAATLLRRAGFSNEGLEAMRQRGEGLGGYRVIATGDGVLARRHASIGDFVEANASLVTLRTGGAVWASLQVPARVAAGLQPGQILRTAVGGEELVLRHKDHSVEGGSQTVGMLAEFKDESAHLPGQIVSVELPAPAGGVWVPASAVVHSGHDTTVFVRTASGVEPRDLRLLPVGANYLAQSGLEVGEEVVVRGAAVLKGITTGLGGPE